LLVEVDQVFLKILQELVELVDIELLVLGLLRYEVRL
jgi:hypothetical protein